MKIPELLSPAGGMPALHAAVDFGADAVYLGYSSFGARASAANFDEEALREAVRYAHLYHCRVYVTVNTLIKPFEMDEVKKALTVIDSSGADAVIVQDLGVARTVLREFPTLALHASTQMAICNASGARLAKQLGYRRVVLARECSLEDIRRVTATGVETEVFVHGALCSGVSGRCLMSSMAGGRSGNRGRCAQPCRQEYSCGQHRGALLSLRDLCLIDHLEELADADVCSLKIEGRLKSPEYVAVVTREYRKALDALKSKTSFNKAQSREELRQIFNRGSFTLGHAFGSEDADMVTGNHVSHEGIPIGVVKGLQGNMAQVALCEALHDGDSLQIHSGREIDLRYSGRGEGKGRIVSVYLRDSGGVKPGSKVFRLASAVQLDGVRSVKPKPIRISGKALFNPEQPSSLMLTDGNNEVTVEGSIPQRAEKRSATLEEARKQLSRFGDTPFTLIENGFNIQLSEGLFLPVGELNALRRKAVESLIEKRIADFSNRICSVSDCFFPKHALQPSFGLTVISPLLSLQTKFQKLGVTDFVYAPRFFSPKLLENELSSCRDRVWLRLPPQMTEACFQQTVELIERQKTHLKGLWLESFSQLGICTELPIVAGEGIPVTNSDAYHMIENSGLSGFCLWPEWTRQERFQASNQIVFWKIYGRQIVMLLNHCPKRCLDGLGKGRRQCSFCSKEDAACAMHESLLIDRKGYRFPLLRTQFPEGCEISVLGALPTDLSAYWQDAVRMNLKPFLHFTCEDGERQLSITDYFVKLLRGESAENPIGSSTTGHWLHGVE